MDGQGVGLVFGTGLNKSIGLCRIFVLGFRLQLGLVLY